MTPLHSPIALKKGEQLRIRSWDTPAPKPEDYEHNGLTKAYQDAYDRWQQSYKEYAVREADESEVTVLLQNVAISHNKDIDWVGGEFKKMLSSGIPCDELIPRLSLGYWCILSQTVHRIEKCDVCNCQPEWTLKPLSVESEDEIWSELLRYATNNSERVIIEIREALKSKYTIQRK